MSRVGNSPIAIPEGVNVDIKPHELVISGKLGSLTQDYDGVSVSLTDNNLIVTRNSESKDHKSKHGLYRALFSNMVTDGEFEIEVKLNDSSKGAVINATISR